MEFIFIVTQYIRIIISRHAETITTDVSDIILFLNMLFVASAK